MKWWPFPTNGQFQQIISLLTQLKAKVDRMAIDQATFDSDLAGLVSSIATLIAAVDALAASKAEVDLTAEDQSVQAAAAQVADELAKLAPPAA
jgi:hypothetical protein